jgi:adenylate cyclase class IV
MQQGLHKNFEIKYKILDNIPPNLDCFNVILLEQKDTYYQVDSGRLKLRKEYSLLDAKPVYYMNRYFRSDSNNARESVFTKYDIRDYISFKETFINNSVLKKEVVVEKQRILILDKNVRIHFDTVVMPNDKGELNSKDTKAYVEFFVEIEILIKTEEDEDRKNETLQYITDKYLKGLNIKPVSESYREIYMNKLKPNKT